jgi:transposase
MAAYSYAFKKKVVDAYLRGEGGYTFLAEKYGVKNRRQVLNWVHYYEELGDDGLKRSRKNETYSFEFKLNVVESYLTSEVSYQELALSLGINNNALIARWVNDYRAAGPDALRDKKRGRRAKMNSSGKAINIQRQDDSAPVDTSTEHVKQLEAELLKLKIENAYLKELRRLRLEEEALLKKQRESSTASEENSN